MNKLFFLLFLCISCLSVMEVDCSMNMQEIEVIYAPPTAQEFVDLRAAAGMPGRTVSSAEKGNPNSLFWITLRKHGKLIGMGRVVGDGGSVVLISDIAVDLGEQVEGCASFIFDRIQEFILEEIPDDAFVCHFADTDMASLCQVKGFVSSQEKWPGMFWPCLDRMQIKARK